MNKLDGDLGLDYVGFIPQIQLGLVNADFEARTIRDPVTNEIIDFGDLSGQTISDYHDEVFANVYDTTTAQQAWTAYHIVRALDSEVWVGLNTLYAYSTAVYLPMVTGVVSADSSVSNYMNFFEWTQDMRTGFVLDKRDWSWTQGDGVNAQVLAAQLGGGASLTLGNMEKASLEGSAVGNGFYSNGGEDLFYSIIAINGESSDAVTATVIDDLGGWINIDVAAAITAVSEAKWLESLTLGAKLSVFNGMSATVWATIESPDERYADIFSAIDAYQADQIVFLTGATSATAGADDTMMLGTQDGDTLTGGVGADLILGGTGHDTLEGDSGNDVLTGGYGADVMSGGVGNDHIAGGIGADWIVYTEGTDTLDGGVGNDYYDVDDATETSATIVFQKGDGHDAISSNANIATIIFEGSTAPT
ncbi:hypothetical protein [Rhizobium sp. FKY42]|uniref:calcium-binding protein n=1 Tax=Rhizobium sp. FKY42 TaxID=2562310 RepID=UPI0010C044FB|nr:hypothetical protein [Rhizobium sp. FKY42]